MTQPEEGRDASQDAVLSSQNELSLEAKVRIYRRDAILTAQSLEDALSLIMAFSAEAGAPVDGAALVRHLLLPDLQIDYTHVIAGAGVFYRSAGIVQQTSRICCGEVFRTRQPAYVPDSSDCPDGYHRDCGSCSDFAFPIMGTKRQQKTVKGLLRLRRNGSAKFTAAERGSMTSLLADLSPSLSMTLRAEDGEYSALCRTIRNKYYGEQLLRDEYENNLRDRHSFSLAIIDFDDTKVHNSEYGYDRVSKMLFLFAEHLRKGLRACDVIYRYGGDEFVLGLVGAVPEDAAKKVDELRRGLFEVHHHQAVGVDLSFSAGIAGYVSPKTQSYTEPPTFDTLFNTANAALQLAKEQKGITRVASS